MSTPAAALKAEVLLEALPYIQKFRGSTFVVKYGGSFMDDPNPDGRDRVATDIAFLAAVGIQVVVVHGGGKAITRAMDGAGIKSEFRGGMRVTDASTVKIVEQTLNVEINGQICDSLRARRLIFMSDVPGLLANPADPSSLITTLKVSEVDELKRKGVIAGGMIPKVDSAVKALREGVRRVHFIDGRVPHSLLLEVFTDKGVGTEIVHG